MITDRDTAVLVDLYKYRYLSVTQVQRLHFPSLQTTYRRLRALSGLGYIMGFTAPGIAEHLYHLGRPGAELVAGVMDINPSGLSWHRTNRAPKDYYFLRHFLQVNDFRIALTQACAASGIDLLGFIPEYFGERRNGRPVKYIKDMVCDIRRPDSSISHTPDAVFALGKSGVPALFFLEIDRGTEVVSDPDKGVLKCASFYVNYLVSGGYQRYAQDFGCDSFRGLRALIVTTTDVRVENIRHAISGLQIDRRAKRFLWLTTASRTAPESILGSIWCSGDVADRTQYGIG